MYQISTERLLEYIRLGRQGEPLGIVQEIEVWPYEQMLYAQPRICPMEFWHTHGSPNRGHTTRPFNNQQKKKRICRILDFAVPAEHRVKLKECEKRDNYIDLNRELKKNVDH